ncbi:MAG: hypothetical protein MUF62_05200 [Chitinophagaceae bacterium]|jgi:hypothetical protein|nr:hypothetical protein [Chitinophagaceae bacterium]
MRTLVALHVLLLCTACHKEFVSHQETPVLKKVKAAVKVVLPAADYQQIDWNQTMPVTTSSAQVLAYHVSLPAITANTYRFLLVNLSGDSVGGVFANEVVYEDLHGGRYPVHVYNQHLQTGTRRSYATRGQLVSERSATAALLPASLVSAGIRLPLVTLTGIFRTPTDPPDAKGAKMAAIDTYILAAVLGFEEPLDYEDNQRQQPSGVLYYDPLQGGRPINTGQPLITWDLLN